MFVERVALVSILLVAGSGCASGPRAQAPLVSAEGLAPLIRTNVGLELVLIPPGDFTMGSAEGPANERPMHLVRLTRPYYMGRTEVTQAAFAAFVADTGYVTTAERSGGAKVWRDGRWVMDRGASFRNVFPGADHPVVAVSFDDALAFAAWLTAHERRAGTLGPDQVLRLPTEAEWERAARGGSDEPYAGVSLPEDLCRIANIPDQSAARAGLGREIIACDDGVGLGTAPVARYRPNAFGLFDMSGNVWEWVADFMGPYSSSPAVDPAGPRTGKERVVRGGSWSGLLHGLVVSHRDGYPASLRGGAIGFRVAMTARQEPHLN